MSGHQAQVASLAGELPEEAAFLSTDGQPFVTLSGGQIISLHEPIFRDWLTWRYFSREGEAPSTSALNDAIRLLRSRACCGPRRSPVALRVAGDGAGSIFVDLANPAGESVEINGRGWQVTGWSQDVTFRSARGQLPLPHPAPAAASAESELPEFPESLKPFRNWLLAALQPKGPYPILILHGPPGSGKTTAARMLRSLLDPVTAPVLGLPSRERAIERLAIRNRVLVFDHVTRMSGSAAGALCRIASGTGIPVSEPGDRREPLMLEVSRPIILTTPRLGLDDWQPRGDLAARAIAIELPAIAEPRPEEEIEAEFEAARPAILAALYGAASREWKQPPSPITPCDLSGASAEADPLFRAIRSFMDLRPEWSGSATELLPLLDQAGCRSPRGLSQRLNLLTRSLRTCGVAVEHHRKHNGTRQIVLRRVPGNLRHPGPAPRPPGPEADGRTNAPPCAYNPIEPSYESS